MSARVNKNNKKCMLSVVLVLFLTSTTHAFQFRKQDIERGCEEMKNRHLDSHPFMSNVCNRLNENENENNRNSNTNSNSNNADRRRQDATEPPVRIINADYVVVGAGSAGALLASRLAKSFPRDKIVLLSSGGDIDGKQDTGPTLWAQGSTQSPHIYFAQDKFTRDPKFYQYPEAVANGGSSAINPGVMVKPPREFWNNIRDRGFASWGYDNIRPIVNSVQEYRGADAANSTAHGQSGEIITETVPIEPSLSVINQCMAELTGYPIVNNQDDFNIGVGPTSRTVATVTNPDGSVRGVRQNVYVKAIQPLLDAQQQNLEVLNFTRCEKATFDSQKQVRQVVCLRQVNSQLIYVNVNRRAIFAADALGVATLLMRSGIGNCDELGAKFDIPCIHNNPHVGRNLMSDYNVPALLYAFDSSVSPSVSGMPLRHNNGNVEMAHFRSSVQRLTASGLPDTQIGYSYLFPGVIVVIPFQNVYKSTGYVTLKTAAPHDHEHVVNNLFLDARDSQPMVETIEIARSAFQCARERGLRIFEIAPTGYLSAANKNEWVKANGIPQYHNHGTAQMGLVTDEFQNVLGVSGLSVVGGAVYPEWIPTHSSHWCAMISGAKLHADIVAERARR